MRRIFRRIFLGTAALVIVTTVVGDRPGQARWFAPSVGRFGGFRMGGYGGYGMGGYGMGGMGWGGAAYGGAAANNMQAMSQVIRANGQWKKDTAEADIKYEDARTKYIDNKEKWVKTWNDMRGQYEAQKASDLERQKHSPKVLAAAARSGQPKPLSSESLDSITGKIDWPEVLQGDDYAVPRQTIDQLFEVRSQADGSGTSMKIRQATGQLLEILKSNIQNLPTGDYFVARRFLESLAFTARPG
ncbi:MAG: hypothetical protein EXS05_08540 [Planctomycetaceae bacterium]|nr:hypothetical protein [Planctomycetaceae bacterium]